MNLRLLGLASVLLTTSCNDNNLFPNCNCPAVATVLESREASFEAPLVYGEALDAGSNAISPGGGTLSTSADSVVVRYERDGVEYEVRYEVVASRY